MPYDLPDITDDEWNDFTRQRFLDQTRQRLGSLSFNAVAADRIGSLGRFNQPQIPTAPQPQPPALPEIPRPTIRPGQGPTPVPAPAPQPGFPTLRPRAPGFLERSQAQIDSLAPPEPERAPVTITSRPAPPRARPNMPLPATPVTGPSQTQAEEPASLTDRQPTPDLASTWKTSFDFGSTYTGNYRTGTPHRGIDLVPARGGGIGEPIQAFVPGTVSLIQRDSGAGGLMVYVQDDQGLTHAYMHLAGTAPNLKVGQRVERGTPIAFMGESGTEGSPHLHYEVRKNAGQGDPLNQLIDPRPYMRGAAAQGTRVPSANPTPAEVRSYIVQAAQQRGIDPDIALRVAASEGGFEAARRGTFQTGSSWWPFQLHYGGQGYEELGTTAGMGNSFTRQTGWQPGDPRAWQAATDYALDRARTNGWGDWYGAKAQGITGMQGIGERPTSTPLPGQIQTAPREDLPPEPALPQDTRPPTGVRWPPQPASGPRTAQSSLGSTVAANPIEQIGSTIATAITDGLTAIFGGAPGGPPGGPPGGGGRDDQEQDKPLWERTRLPLIPEYMRLPELGKPVRDPLERFREYARMSLPEGITQTVLDAADEAMQRQYPGLGPGGLSLVDPRLSDPGADLDFGDLGRALGQGGDALRGGLEATNRLGEGLLAAGRGVERAAGAAGRGVQAAADVVGAPLRGAADALAGTGRVADEVDLAAEQAFSGPIGEALRTLEQRPMTRQEIADAQAALTELRQSGERFVGMPQQYATPEGLARLRARIRTFAEMGASQKDWYSDSSRAILQAAQGNLRDAERLAQLVAIYSPNTPVDANMNNALMAWYQWKNGDPIKVAMGPQDQRATDLLVHNKQWEGRKTNNFYRNLMQHIDPTIFRSWGEAGQSGVTADIWMMRAFDYLAGPNSEGRRWLKAPSPAQYDFIQDEVARAGRELGWSPEQSQAAIWSSVKAAAEGSDLAEAGFHYGSALDARMAQVSYTASPGTAEMQNIPGYMDAPEQERAVFNTASDRALYDPETGEDIPARVAGLPRGRTVEAPEVYGSYVGPGLQAEVPVPSHRTSRVEPVLDDLGQAVLDEEGKPKTRSIPIKERFGMVHPAARAALNSYAAMRGILLKQDAVPWTRLFWANAPLRDSNIAYLHVGRVLSSGEADAINRALVQTLGGDGTHAVVATPDGAWVLNLSGRFERDAAAPPNIITTPFKKVDTGATNARGQKVWAKAEGPFVREENVVGTWVPTTDDAGNEVYRRNEDFWESVKEAIRAVDFDGDPDAHLAPLRGDGEYVFNDWEIHPNGENYRSLLESHGRAAAFANVEPALTRRVQEAQADVARRFGWPDNPNNPFSGAPDAAAARPGGVRSGGLSSNVADELDARGPPGRGADALDLGGLARREEGAASPVFAARAGASALGGTLGYATAPEGASPEERALRAGVGAGVGLGLSTAATRGLGRAAAAAPPADLLSKLPSGASPEVRAAAVDAQKILASRAGATLTPLVPEDVERVIGGVVQLAEETTDRRAKLKAIEDYLEKKNGSLPYADSVWLRARVFEGHKDAALATVESFIGASHKKLDAAERDMLDVVLEQRDNIDKARGLARRREREIMGVDVIEDAPGRAAWDKAEQRVRGFQSAIKQAAAKGADTKPLEKRLASAQKVLERRKQTYETNVAKARTEQEDIAQTEAGILFDRRQFSGGATAQSYDAIRDMVEATMGTESASRIFNAMDDDYALMRYYRRRLVDAGVISPAAGDFLERNYPNYIPIELMDKVSPQAMDAMPSGGRTFSVGSSGIKTIGEASQTGPRISPRRSMLDAAFAAESAAQRNEITSRAALWADDPDMQHFVQRLKGDEPVPRGFTTISFMDGAQGKQRLAVIDPLYKAFDLARPEATGLLGALLNAARMPLQAGATALRPGFIAFNMANDMLWTLTRFVSEAPNVLEGMRSVGDFAKGYTAQLPERLGGDPKLIERYRRAGGSIGMQTRWQDRPDMLLRELHGESFIPVRTIRSEEGMRTFLKDMWGVTTDVAGLAWSRPLGLAGRPTERAPRLAAFARAERLGRGSATEAAQAGRTITADFDAGGYTTKALNQVVPFLNATTQASVEGGALAKRRPAQLAATIAGIMSPIVITEIYNRAAAPEEYANVDQKTKDTGLVVMYQNPMNDSAWEPLYVPMRGIVGAPIPLMRELIGRTFGENRRSYIELLQAMMGAVSPVDPDVGNLVTTFMPPPAKLGAELLSNRNFYRNQPIVSQSMANRVPEDQYDAGTSQTARLLGRSDLPGVGGKSPKMIDYAVRNFSPGPGEALLAASDALIRNFGLGQPEHPDKKPSARDIPIAGAVLGRFFRTTGEQQQQDAYDLADRIVQRNRRVMLDALEASPAWQRATFERRMQLSASLERQLTEQAREIAGVQQQPRDLGLPFKYIGVSSLERQAEIDEAISTVSAYRTNPRANPRPSAKQVNLARLYARRINPRYTAASRRQGQETEQLGASVRRQLASEPR